MHTLCVYVCFECNAFKPSGGVGGLAVIFACGAWSNVLQLGPSGEVAGRSHWNGTFKSFAFGFE